DGGELKILDGRFGPYVKYKKLNVTVPEPSDPMEITLEEVLALLQAKMEKAGQKSTKAKSKVKSKTRAKKADRESD
nr:hypothetical protein [Alphaproteobacteria bacterium]